MSVQRFQEDGQTVDPMMIAEKHLGYAEGSSTIQGVPQNKATTDGQQLGNCHNQADMTHYHIGELPRFLVEAELSIDCDVIDRGLVDNFPLYARPVCLTSSGSILSTLLF